MPTIWTLGSDEQKTQFSYSIDANADWKLLVDGETDIPGDLIRAIVVEFKGSNVPGGFDEAHPTPGGFSEFVVNISKSFKGLTLTTRDAAYLAAIMVHEGMIYSRVEGDDVMLHFPP